MNSPGHPGAARLPTHAKCTLHGSKIPGNGGRTQETRDLTAAGSFSHKLFTTAWAVGQLKPSGFRRQGGPPIVSAPMWPSAVPEGSKNPPRGASFGDAATGAGGWKGLSGRGGRSADQRRRRKPSANAPRTPSRALLGSGITEKKYVPWPDKEPWTLCTPVTPRVTSQMPGSVKPMK